jgi:hypothetical protein
MLQSNAYVHTAIRRNRQNTLWIVSADPSTFLSGVCISTTLLQYHFSLLTHFITWNHTKLTWMAHLDHLVLIWLPRKGKKIPDAFIFVIKLQQTINRRSKLWPDHKPAAQMLSISWPIISMPFSGRNMKGQWGQMNC